VRTAQEELLFTRDTSEADAGRLRLGFNYERLASRLNRAVFVA